GTEGVLTSPGRTAVFVQGHNQGDGAAALRDLKFSLDDTNKLASVRAWDLSTLGATPPPTVVDDFVDCILAGDTSTSNLERAVHMTEQMTAAYESSAAGGVRVPLTSTFVPNSGLPGEVFAIGDCNTSQFTASGRFR